MDEIKKAVSGYTPDERALHNIKLLSEAYRKLVDEIIPAEQGSELHECYKEFDCAFRKVIKREAIDIATA